MSKPYGVLNAGEWRLRCRACAWRGLSYPADPPAMKTTLREAEAEWRAHLCTQDRVAGERLSVVAPPPPSIREVA
jgi:hypothetical protein